MYSFCAMYSLRMSFWMVPKSRDQAAPCFSAAAKYIAHKIAPGRGDRHRGGHLGERDALEKPLEVGPARRPPPRTCRPRLQKADRRCRNPSTWADRRPPTTRSALATARSGSGCWSVRACRSPKTAASSTAAPGTSPMNAAGVGKLTGLGEVLGRVEIGEVVGGIDLLDVGAGKRRMALGRRARRARPGCGFWRSTYVYASNSLTESQTR